MSWNVGQVVTLSVDADEDDTRLDRWLRRKFHGLTQGQIEKSLRRGEIRVDGARARSSTRLRSGQSVRVPPMGSADDETRSAPAPARVRTSDADMMRSLVIYEDEEVIALNKPQGLAVQGGTGTSRHIDALSRALVADTAEKPRLVHRLDRDTTGVLVLARTVGAANRLGALFRTRDLEKIYWAVTVGAPHPQDGEIRGWMIKSSGPGEDREKMRPAEQAEKGSVHAITQYTTVSNAGQRAAWVALKPETGRTHQLRYHMAGLGCAIVGDRKYVCDRPTPSGLSEGLHLHARALRLPRRSGPPADIIADLPDHMAATFSVLGFDASQAADPFFSLKKIRRR
ncbi:MAG: RluA family pseudouridine synthase [Alphaproteobacteria bacterium]|nr:RluA family pseudouridine synthase [Alphaproteobacteria bacterium]